MPCIPALVLVPGFEPSMSHFRYEYDRGLCSFIQSSLPEVSSTSSDLVKEKQVDIRENIQARNCKQADWAANRVLDLKRLKITKTAFFTNQERKFIHIFCYISL